MVSGHRLLLLAAPAFALALNLAGGPQTQAAGKEKLPESEPFGRFTVNQVERRLGQPNVHVFDGNSPETYAEHHLPGAVRINHKDITASVLPQDKDATLIFYCMNEL
jgi:rhodanese-like protein